MQHYVTLEEAARELETTRNAVYAYVRKTKTPVKMIGHTITLRLLDLAPLRDKLRAKAHA